MGVLKKLFGKYLLLTNTVSCGLMMGFGDILQQQNEHWNQHDEEDSLIAQNKKLSDTDLRAKEADKKPLNHVDIDDIHTEYEYDYTRTRNMVIVGAAQGPFNHYFYAILDRTLPRKDAISIVKKTLLDQLIASPACLAIFFFGLGVLEHKRIEDINNEVKLKFMDTWKVDCCFWPPVQCLNFILVPTQYRVIYINVMTMIYNVFLSYMKMLNTNDRWKAVGGPVNKMK